MPSQRKDLTAVERAAEYGVDLSLLESSLRMTPEERLRAHDAALELALELRRAMIEHETRHAGTDPKAR